MKIKFKDINQEKLKKIKETLDEVINMNFEEMELTEENLKKAKEISDKLYKIGNSTFTYGALRLTIEASDGTKLTII